MTYVVRRGGVDIGRIDGDTGALTSADPTLTARWREFEQRGVLVMDAWRRADDDADYGDYRPLRTHVTAALLRLRRVYDVGAA